jgi:hypothetical protein
MLILWLMEVGVSIVGGLDLVVGRRFICDTLMFMDIMLQRDSLVLFSYNF